MNVQVFQISIEFKSGLIKEKIGAFWLISHGSRTFLLREVTVYFEIQRHSYNFRVKELNRSFVKTQVRVLISGDYMESKGTEK